MSNSTILVNMSIACHDGYSLFIFIESILYEHKVKYTCNHAGIEIFYLVSNITLEKAMLIKNDILDIVDNNTFCIINLIKA